MEGFAANVSFADRPDVRMSRLLRWNIGLSGREYKDAEMVNA
jgi:hypothetical protein